MWQSSNTCSADLDVSAIKCWYFKSLDVKKERKFSNTIISENRTLFCKVISKLFKKLCYYGVVLIIFNTCHKICI